MRAREPLARSAASPIASRNVVYSLPSASRTTKRVLPPLVSNVLTSTTVTSSSIAPWIPAALWVVAGDCRGHPVLGHPGGVHVDGVVEDRKGDRVTAGDAVAGERRDVGERPGLRRTVALRSRSAHPVGDRALPTGDRQRVHERLAELGVVLHRGQELDDLLRGDAVVARQPRAVARLDVRARGPRELLHLAGAAVAPAADGREPLEEHLGEEVVGGHVRLLDQPRGGRRGDLGQRVALERDRSEVGAPDAPGDLDAALDQRLPEALGGDQLRRARVIAAVVAVVEGETGEGAQVGTGASLPVEDRVVRQNPARD